MHSMQQYHCHLSAVPPAAAASARKQHARALELFVLGLAAPTHAFNAITAATFKKYVLVSIIHTGGQEQAAAEAEKGTL